MDRRQILLGLGAAALLVPTRSIFLPPRGGWFATPWDRVIPDGSDGILFQGWLFEENTMRPWRNAPCDSLVLWQEADGRCYLVDATMHKRELSITRYHALFQPAQLGPGQLSRVCV